MRTELRVVIIEDEAATARNLVYVLKTVDPDIQVLVSLASLSDAAHWFSLHPEAEYDLIFSDIRLNDGLSFELFTANTIPKPVIFVTAYHDHAIEAFRNNGIDYILKPFDTDEISRALAKYHTLLNISHRSNSASYGNVQRQLQQGIVRFKRSFLIHHRDRLIPVETAQLQWFYTSHDVVHACTSSGMQYIIPFTLEQLEDQLDPDQFFRANRQCIVNRHSIGSVEYFFNGRLLLKLLPPPPETILVSKAKAMLFRKWMDQ